MSTSPVNGAHPYQPVQHTQPVPKDNEREEKPPVKETESPPPKQGHDRAKQKHQVDIRV